jgi:hypothetical protein
MAQPPEEPAVTFRTPRPRFHGPAVLITLLVALALPLPAAFAADAGVLRIARGAESSFDVYTSSPTAGQKAFMLSHYWRLRAYSPYFDSRLSWSSDTWVYQDAYAIYPNTPEATQHADWILKDPAGNKLWVQYGCSGGSCTQYAADIGNPAFRAWWIDGAKA